MPYKLRTYPGRDGNPGRPLRMRGQEGLPHTSASCTTIDTLSQEQWKITTSDWLWITAISEDAWPGLIWPNLPGSNRHPFRMAGLCPLQRPTPAAHL